MLNQNTIVNDVTELNPIEVWSISTPKTVEDISDALQKTSGPISVGGGRFSMGGQTASENSLHLDMRYMNKILLFNPVQKFIRVQAGVRWCDIQKFIDPHDLSVQIMQTYANFTVAGSLSVNVHGRYIGLGPLIMSVREIKIILADGALIEASAEKNAEIFYGAIGGYGGLGIIVEVELDLADNGRLERTSQRMKRSEYLEYFTKNIRNSEKAILHNADIYTGHYSKVNAVTWNKTTKSVTHKGRLQPVTRSYWLEKYFFWVFSETRTGKWQREHILDPLLYRQKKIHWRNYEAGYDAAELEPVSRKERTYVLQEYFVPIRYFDEFTEKMGEILNRHKVNIINVSVRHAAQDPGSLLAWAQEEVFAFVLYYKQRVRENAKQRVAIWTRELIDAALSCEGTYYLPYQAHATQQQFHAAYPKAKQLFALKKKLDPDFRFRNVIWDQYYCENNANEHVKKDRDMKNTASEFHDIYKSTKWRDHFYLFLQNVFRLVPEDRFHQLICEAVEKYETDEEIYRYLQAELPNITPFLADLTFGLPALKKQKKVISEQSLSLLDKKHHYDGYLEIGSSGRYFSALKKSLKFKGQAYFSSDVEPTNSLGDIIDRGQIGQFGPYFDLNDYAPISQEQIADNSLDLVTCYIGLHHIAPEKQAAYVASIVRVLRPGGTFILRDHDAKTEKMKKFVSLVHTVFNSGTEVSWEENAKEPRFFEGVNHWVSLMEKSGLRDTGGRLYQDNDPSDNVLMAFIKQAEEV